MIERPPTPAPTMPAKRSTKTAKAKATKKTAPKARVFAPFKANAAERCLAQLLAESRKQTALLERGVEYLSIIAAAAELQQVDNPGAGMLHAANFADALAGEFEPADADAIAAAEIAGRAVHLARFADDEPQADGEYSDDEYSDDDDDAAMPFDGDDTDGPADESEFDDDARDDIEGEGADAGVAIVGPTNSDAPTELYAPPADPYAGMVGVRKPGTLGVVRDEPAGIPVHE